MTNGPSARCDTRAWTNFAFETFNRIRAYLAVGVVLLVCSFPVHASQSVTAPVRVIPSESHRGRLQLPASAVSLRELLAAIQLHTDHRIILRFEGDRLVRMSSRLLRPREAIREAVRVSGLRMNEGQGVITITNPLEPVLHLNVKDAAVRDILKSVRDQCGIRNLIIDPEVGGEGTFLFVGVPCGEGLRVILASLGLAAEVESGLVWVKGSDR